MVLDEANCHPSCNSFHGEVAFLGEVWMLPYDNYMTTECKRTKYFLKLVSYSAVNTELLCCRNLVSIFVDDNLVGCRHNF
jgi:hypothetical protein